MWGGLANALGYRLMRSDSLFVLGCLLHEPWNDTLSTSEPFPLDEGYSHQQSYVLQTTHDKSNEL